MINPISQENVQQIVAEKLLRIGNRFNLTNITEPSALRTIRTATLLKPSLCGGCPALLCYSNRAIDEVELGCEYDQDQDRLFEQWMHEDLPPDLNLHICLTRNEIQ